MDQIHQANQVQDQASVTNSQNVDEGCGICFQIFNSQKKPHTLPCGHTFCRECLQGQQDHLDSRCSVCKQYYNFTILKPNNALLALVDKLQHFYQQAPAPPSQAMVPQNNPVPPQPQVPLINAALDVPLGENFITSLAGLSAPEFKRRINSAFRELR